MYHCEYVLNFGLAFLSTGHCSEENTRICIAFLEIYLTQIKLSGIKMFLVPDIPFEDIAVNAEIN